MTKTITLTIQGMTCDHCRVAVAAELAKLKGATSIDVDYRSGSATLAVSDDVTRADVDTAIDEAGYSLISIDVAE